MNTTETQMLLIIFNLSRKLLYGSIKDKLETAGVQSWKRLQSFCHKLLVAMCGSKKIVCGMNNKGMQEAKTGRS